jgi:pimeloyl-ACP methyl ester carboxylesterase
VKSIEFMDLNGARQCVSIRGSNPRHPLLLYLHGGPGDAALPLVAKYNRQLENHFVVAVWEQRGAGKSYAPFSAAESLTIATFLEDLHSLVRYLLERFQQEKLYLVGHSWGSVLGMMFIQRYPQLIYAYVGCGQVVNMQKSARIAYDFALQKNKDSHNSRVYEKLSSIDCSYRGDTWFRDLLFVTGQVVKYKGSLYGKKNYNRFIADYLLSPEYSLKELLSRQKGARQSIMRLWPELMLVDFEPVTAFDVPVVFVEGRGDVHVSSALAYAYYETIKNPKQFYWFEQSCHFPQWSEPEKFAGIMKSLLPHYKQEIPPENLL